MFTTGTYPDLLKVSKVISIHKKGDRHFPENYRLISLLPCVNKILERVFEKHLRKFWNDNEILFDLQFGFRNGRDTSHALLKTINSIRSFLDKGENVLCLYLDRKKAFNHVNHRILAHKLYTYSICRKAYNVYV